MQVSLQYPRTNKGFHVEAQWTTSRERGLKMPTSFPNVWSPKVISRTKLQQQRLARHFVPVMSQASYDDEFRSSRSIGLGLHKRYKDVVQGGLSKNLKEFINAAVTAYAIGCTEEGLRKELLNAITRDRDFGNPDVGNVGVKSTITKEEVEECILWVTVIFTTIMSSPPPTVVRWSSQPALSSESLLEWKGFCGIIANAYYERGMAWLPVKTLQMEQMAVVGRAEEASVVADRMTLAFTTLEIVCPQWPKR